MVGLNPRIKEEDLLQTLRGEQYFGQYGKIVKIVVNKRTAQDPAVGGYANQNTGYDGKNSGGMGVYVTFARKQDAATCIAAVDGSVNGDRVLRFGFRRGISGEQVMANSMVVRATYGTTKYCSAYLRNETCPNKNCMFLHEPGEEAESFSRLDLSSINASQRPPAGQVSSAAPQRSVAAAETHHHPTPQPQPLRSNSTQPGHDPGEGSALPPTVSWASKNPATPVARAAIPVHPGQSHTPSNVATPSPKVAHPQLAKAGQTLNLKAQQKLSPAPAKAKTPSPPPVEQPSISAQASVRSAPPPPSQPSEPAPQPVSPELQLPKINLKPQRQSELEKGFLEFAECFKAVSLANLKFVFSPGNLLSAEDMAAISKTPCFFDPAGGAKRKNAFGRPEQDDIRLKLLQASQAQQAQVQQQTTQQHLQAQQAQQQAQAAQQQQQQAAQQAQQQAQHAQQQAQQAQHQAQQAQQQAQQAQHQVQQLQQQQQQNQQQLSSHQQGLPPVSVVSNAALSLAQAQGSNRHLTQQQQQLQILLKQGQNLGYQPEALQQQQQQQQQQQSLRAHTPGNTLNSLAGSTQVNHQFNPFAGGSLPQQAAGGMHARQSSRYTFANDNPSNASAAIKPTANAQHMAQQATMMPPQQLHQQNQQAVLASQYFGMAGQPSSMQAPPPGLKSAPTPPAPGMGMMSGVFNQQGNFNLQGHQATHSKSDAGAEFYQQLIRGRDGKCKFCAHRFNWSQSNTDLWQLERIL